MTLLPTRAVVKPWGRADLPAAFGDPASKVIGEIWFEPPADFSAILAKYIFTSEPLSVQVHPPGGAGKDECWLILAADPGARLAIGLSGGQDRAELAAAACDGSITDLLDWYPVKAGDFFYVPAGTIHAIGAGLSLIEVQQNIDLTYRLYDYGRPRQLHLEEGLAAVRSGPHPPELRRHLPAEGSLTLVEGPVFRLDRLAGTPDATITLRYGDQPVLVMPLRGTARVDQVEVGQGQCAVASSLQAVQLPADGMALIAQPCR